MKKNFNVMSKTALSALIASAAIVPVMAAPTASAATAPVSDVIYSVDGQNTSISFDKFSKATNAGVVKDLDIKNVKAGNGKYYLFSDFSKAINAFDSVDEALESLTTSDKDVVLEDVVEGTINPDTGGIEAPEAPVEDAFEVTDIAAINKTGVTVNFPSSEQDRTDVTVEVNDPSGKVVPVKAISTIKAGATEATFEFVTPLESIAAGTWTVGDKTLDVAGDITAESVKAVSQSIAKSTATPLKFTVNGVEYTKASFDKAFGEAGYTIQFLSNKTLAGFKTSGSVNTADDFKYAVEVLKDGKNVNTAIAKDFASVKVVDAIAATKINAIGLVDNSGDAWENPTVTAGDTVKIAATEFENGLGQKNTDVDEEGELTSEAQAIVAPTVKTAVSSNPTVAYYDKETGVIVRNKDGKVTFTVTFEEKAFEGKEYTIDVNVKAEQTATSIEAKDLKVKADEEQTLDIKVLDQDGEAMRTATTLYYTTTVAGEAEAETATKLEGNKVTFAKGVQTVNIYTDAAKEDKIGSFSVDAVDVSPEAEIDTYKFTVADDSKDEEGNVKPLDLNKESKVNNESLKLDVNAFIEDINVSLDDTTLEVKSSNEEVATVEYNAGVATVTALKAGDTTITLYTKEGDLLTPVATYDVTVNDTTKAVETLTLKDNTKVIVPTDLTTADNQEDLKTAVAAAVKEDMSVGEDATGKIEKVELVPASNIVIVTMTDAYGAGEFVLDAVYGTSELESAVLVDAVDFVEGDAATKAKATVGEVNFEAATAGEIAEEDKIEIKIVQGEATDGSPVDASAELADNVLTITLGATWGEESSEVTELKAKEVQALLTTAGIADVVVGEDSLAAETVVAEASGELIGGTDKGADIPAEAATLTFTYSEAVQLDGDFSFFVTAAEESEAVKVTVAPEDVDLSEDGKKVVVSLTPKQEADVIATSTITDVKGLKAVKGIIVAPEAVAITQ